MERIFVARIARAHGLNGGLVLQVETDSPGLVFTPGTVLEVERARPGLPTRLTVREAHAHGRGWILRVEEVSDRTFAEQYAGAWLALPRGQLPELGEDEYFLHDLVGLEVVDEELGPIGKVEDVYDVPGGPLLAVRVEGRERLLPFRSETVAEVDLEAGTVRTRLPVGLLEV